MAACSQGIVESTAGSTAALSGGLSGARFVPPGESANSGTASATYGQGPVLANVQVIAVFWGNGVNSTVVSNIGPFYKAMTDNSYMDWLQEYNTPGQLIGRGSLGGTYTIQPSNKSVSLTDAQINAELASQIQAGNLPVPNLGETYPPSNTVYAIHFPPGITIAGPSGDGNSCQSGGFCGYHNSTTKTIGGVSVPLPYVVLPDFGPGSGCDTGCGADTMFQNFTSTASHEVAEALTDPEPFSGWSPEIGDPCNQQHTTITSYTGSNAVTYTVQKLWSNLSNGCVAAGSEFLPAGGTGACATSIGVGPNSQAWIVGCTSNGSGGNSVYHLKGPGNWVQVPMASATRITVSPEGTPWAINAQGVIYEWNGSAFAAVSPNGCASSIGVGPNSDAWVVGCSSVGAGGNGIFHFTGGAWVQISGAAATEIAVSPDGTPWSINKQGTIFEWNGQSFAAVNPSGCATQIGVGPGGEAWVIGCSAVNSGGNGVFHLVGSQWVQISGAAATQLGVSPEGTPWALNAQGTIYE
jgi:hypothetical protein